MDAGAHAPSAVHSLRWPKTSQNSVTRQHMQILGRQPKSKKVCLNRKCAVYIYLPRFARKPRRRGLRGVYLSGVL